MQLHQNTFAFDRVYSATSEHATPPSQLYDDYVKPCVDALVSASTMLRLYCYQAVSLSRLTAVSLVQITPSTSANIAHLDVAAHEILFAKFEQEGFNEQILLCKATQRHRYVFSMQ